MLGGKQGQQPRERVPVGFAEHVEQPCLLGEVAFDHPVGQLQSLRGQSHRARPRIERIGLARYPAHRLGARDAVGDRARREQCLAVEGRRRQSIGRALPEQGAEHGERLPGQVELGEPAIGAPLEYPCQARDAPDHLGRCRVEVEAARTPLRDELPHRIIRLMS